MKIWLCVFLLFMFVSSCKNNSENDMILKLVEKNEPFISENIKQILLVFNEEENSHKATLAVLEKIEDSWSIVYDSIPAGIGRNGFATLGEKREGDGKSPSGIFKLGNLFTYKSKVDTRMHFTQSKTDDKWIDDANSPDYNTHVSGETSAESYENLLLRSDYYKYCMVIEYNTNPVEKGKGSAIFFHLNMEDSESTAGCVAISEKNMLEVLKWLDPVKNPMILMGNRDVLISGLEK